MQAESKGVIELALAVDANVPTADYARGEERLTQIITNLLVNAIKFTDTWSTWSNWGLIVMMIAC